MMVKLTPSLVITEKPQFYYTKFSADLLTKTWDITQDSLVKMSLQDD